ncbi:hypothetical protein P152DRAFT_200942 [Eremomyces bilateralis CBS 781.70]|uniref:Uncharacterized protein n=1 Tax=Eremomyces bilateralis CBS 781.70 TaxID=1392243 RepID=A0A6G1GCZ3_9PEZI|nr:uncharacterized protein P152DRAFT_200942 [Eremomyces bilateralis CBS 781.70]KAF1815893.1 hypothetical protein P152DRAFT_200942 [Eremomyces bilateralis CBS 781.70]
MFRNDPRLRRTLNQLSQNLEAANETAQVGLYSFSQTYIDPCVSSVTQCLTSCVGTCFPSRDEKLRQDRARRRTRGRGRAELNFDFYDDWDEEGGEDSGILAWGNDELDRLLSGSGSRNAQPGREQVMSYGTRRDRLVSGERGRRKSGGQPHDVGVDPTIIPNSNYFGFLGRLPWKIGGKGLKYRPSAADLQDHPGQRRAGLEWDESHQPLIEDSEEEAWASVSHPDGRGKAKGNMKRHTRNRSSTTASGQTEDSLSSRGDIFPSEDELDDAVPLDDEFAMVLETRPVGSEEALSGKTDSKRPSRSRVSTRSVSSKSIRHDGEQRIKDAKSRVSILEDEDVDAPMLDDLKDEDLRLERQEEEDISRKRRAAHRLAMERGLPSNSPKVCRRHARSFPRSLQQ